MRFMKRIQTHVPEEEYELLRRRAHTEGRPMKEVIREALRAHLLPEKVDPRDPKFTAFPLVRGKGRRERTSVEHDRLLSPERR